jgi:hypothetical protein
MENKHHIVESTKMVTAQTAMQALIAWGDEMLLKHPEKILSFSEVIDKAEELLQMEKEQIIKAFDVACDDPDRIGREYYRDTYETYNVL